MSWFQRKSKKKAEDMSVNIPDKIEGSGSTEQKIIEVPEITKELILKILHPIKDPDLGVSIVDLGLIKEVDIDGAKVKVGMVLTSPGCPYGPLLLTMAQRMLELEEYLEELEVELLMGQYLSLDDLTDEQRLNLGLDF